MERCDKLGEGTFGIVYSALSPKSNKQYAIKRNLVEDDTSFIGVPREVDVLNKLRNHPHIVRLERVTFGQPFGVGCFSPLIGQERKSQRDDAIHFVFNQAAYDLHRFVYGAVITDFSLIKRYMINILLGVEYTHANRIIHRDLKPSNILIFGSEKDALGVGNIAKICDFGLAKPYTYQGTQTPSTVTSWYRAPEITLGYPHYDYKSDIWSLGCILYEMVAKRAFIPDVPDNNDVILSSILGALPQQLPMRKLRELVRSNKWRTVQLTSVHNPKVRRSFTQQMGFSNELLEQFEKQAGPLERFCDLLENMLRFEWDQRYTATQCIDHPFFEEFKQLIAETRRKYIPQPRPQQIILTRNSVERRWMSQAATEIFNNRGSLHWYTHRALFQAMDLFDRYLSVMFHVTPIPPNSLESDLKGLIHDKFGAELRFMTCLYLCIKYFSSIHHPVKYDTIVAEEYRTAEAKLIAEQFEGGFIKNCLEYDIYRTTIYEAADDFNDKLEDSDIRDLIILYSMNNTFSGMKPSELYQYYRTHLRGRPMEMMFSPIVKPAPVEEKLPNNSSVQLNKSVLNKPALNLKSRPTRKDNPITSFPISSSTGVKIPQQKAVFPYKQVNNISGFLPKFINQKDILRPLVVK